MNQADFFACRFPSTYATMYFKEIMVPPKIRVVPSGTLSRSLDLENFAAAHCHLACAIYSNSGQSAVDCSASGGNRLACVVSAAYSIGLRPLTDGLLSHWM